MVDNTSKVRKIGSSLKKLQMCMGFFCINKCINLLKRQLNYVKPLFHILKGSTRGNLQIQTVRSFYDLTGYFREPPQQILLLHLSLSSVSILWPHPWISSVICLIASYLVAPSWASLLTYSLFLLCKSRPSQSGLSNPPRENFNIFNSATSKSTSCQCKCHKHRTENKTW